MSMFNKITQQVNKNINIMIQLIGLKEMQRFIYQIVSKLSL
jgi:hypothetical protein